MANNYDWFRDRKSLGFAQSFLEEFGIDIYEHNFKYKKFNGRDKRGMILEATIPVHQMSKLERAAEKTNIREGAVSVQKKVGDAYGEKEVSYVVFHGAHIFKIARDLRKRVRAGEKPGR